MPDSEGYCLPNKITIIYIFNSGFLFQLAFTAVSFVLVEDIMARSDLCSIEEIRDLVHSFYDRIRTDEMLGPVFNQHIRDWDTHLSTMVSFWSSLMIGAGTYDGTPMPKHAALPGLRAEMFHHWLALFRQTTDTLPNRLMAERANEYAQRIARSLWFGYQITHSPNSVPRDLHHG